MSRTNLNFFEKCPVWDERIFKSVDKIFTTRYNSPNDSKGVDGFMMHVSIFVFFYVKI